MAVNLYASYLPSAQAAVLPTLNYTDGTSIGQDPDIVREIIGMILSYGYQDTLDFLSQATGPDYILWEQPGMDIGRRAVEREITISQTQQVGVKGVGKCRYCPSTELTFARKQMASGDEATAIFVRCVMCGKGWKE
jgi:hypothetical protein